MKYSIVLCIVACSGVFAQPDNGRGTIYLSVDRGVNWLRADKGLPSDAFVNAWTTSFGAVIAGTDRHGIFISSDGLKSWYSSSKGLPRNVRILSIVVAGNLIFVGSHQHGLFYSDDRGESWHPANKGLTDSNVRVLYHLNGYIFAGTDVGLFISGDAGILWSPVLGGLQINAMTLQINSITSTRKELFVATNKGVLRTSDLGKTWTWLFSQAAISALTFDGTDLYMLDFSGNVYKARKENYVWIKADVFLPFRYTFTVTPAGNRFFVSDWIKVLRGIENTEEVLWANGIPEDLFIGKLLNTPFGVIAAVGGGC